MDNQPSQFTSNYKAMRITARHGHPILHPVTGTQIDEVKELTAEFGVHRGEVQYTNPETGITDVYGDIVGGFYDLDADAEAKGWSDDEKEAMRRHLILHAQTIPDQCQIHSAAAVPAPWPTYDTTHHFKIPGLAVELGLVEHALIYEQQSKNREGVVKALQDKIGAEAAAEEGTAEAEPVEEELTPA